MIVVDRMRGGAFVAGVLVVAGLAGCVKQAVPPPPPSPSVNPAPSASPSEPEALMAAIRGLVGQAGVGDDIREREIEVGEWYGPCDLLIADPDRSKVGGLEFDQVWGAGLEVNPVSSFTNVQRPTTLLDVTVIGLPDAPAAVATARAARTAPCPREAFRLVTGMATARWGARTVTIESTTARLTTATVSRVDPETAGGMTFLPGDARLILAHGRLLISIEALTFSTRKLNTAAEVTAMAQEKATSLATAIVKTLPTASEG
ncbi:hypothetical protein [Micromonospora sp. NPDC006431]|uniref:hypothetical protein n=1 Tax=Micromonospora sp. NPDC006431 TaxID=3364235 RepID=UPI0036879476